MGKVYIVEAKRSGVGSFGGTLKDLPATDIAAAVVKAAIENAGVLPENVDEVILGQVLQAGTGMGPGRQVSIKAGIPVEKPAYVLNMLCSSGMKAVMAARSDILTGDADLVVAGGMENMSAAPFILPASIRWGHKLGSVNTVDHILSEGLTDVFHNYHMGITAENIAKKHRLSREDQDEFALESQKRAAAATASGRFKDEIVPIEIRSRKGSVFFETDEHVRTDATVESLSRLRPAFDPEGTVTAGNASGINDGAAILLVASESAVERFQLKPLVEIVAAAQSGIEPALMGLGPVSGITSALRKASLELKNLDLIELNEAFAAQSLGVIRELADKHNVSEEWIRERCNVNGGAIALGHPLGASGARILVTLIHEMVKREVKTGLASLCAGGGMSTAIVLRRV